MSYYNQGQPPIGVPPPQGNFVVNSIVVSVFWCWIDEICGVRLQICVDLGFWWCFYFLFFFFLGYPPEGYPKDAYPPPGYPPQGYPPPGAYPPQGYPPPYAPQYGQPPPRQQLSSGPGCLEGW